MKGNKATLINELSQIVYDWLIMSGNKVNAKYCREEIEAHPDYPAMTAVIDFLDSGRMAYQAVQADASHINEFNYPVLAHIRQPGQEYIHIIPSIDAWEKQKEVTQNWTGVTIFPEKNATWQNEENISYQRRAIKTRVIAATLILAGLGLFIFSIFQWQSFSVNLFGLLSLTGLVISIFALGTELGYQSQIVKQVCGIVSKGGCDKVLKSSHAKGIMGITPADASLIYFATQYSIYLLSSLYPVLLQSIIILAFSGIAIATWSIYTQAVKLKQWCALCLGIVAILILQIITAFWILPIFLSYTIFPYIVFASLFVLLASAILPVKQLMKINMINKRKLIELKKWKMDASLFMAQWQQQQSVNTTIWENDLLLGNPNAPLQITVACNPYCGPCAKAHIELDNLIHKYKGKVSVLLRLLCNSENESDMRTIAVQAILRNAVTIKNNQSLSQMLSDWFKRMDYNKWISNWEVEEEIDVKQTLAKHNYWVKQNNIAFTPTFFVNGRKIPGRYSLSDIEILIPQLADILPQVV